MNSTLHSRAVLARRIAAACGAGVLLLGAGACGSDDPEASSAATGTSTTAPQTNPSGPGRMPGADGKVAAVDGTTAQVQSQQNGQVAVTWTSATAFTQQVAASLADVTVGRCVMVAPADADSDSSDGEAATEVTAGTVRITPPVDGDCTPALGGPAGQGPVTGSQGTPPDGAGPPPGGDGQTRFRGAAGAFGTVSAVSASGFTVDSGGTEPTEVTVTVSKATTYTTTAKATAADVAVGTCLRAQGDTDDQGAVTATTIALSPAVEGECGGLMIRSRDADGEGS